MHDTGAAGQPHAHDDEPRDDGKPRIAFVGAGHVGTALAVAFDRAGWPVTAVASRDEERRRQFSALVAGARAFAEPNAVLDDADVIFLTVPDDAIAATAGQLSLYSGQALVHTSGALAANVLQPAMAAGTSLGSFHPLVAFADLDRAVDALSGATIAVEGDDTLVPLLADLARSIGAQPVTLPPGTKSAYHAAAAMAAGGAVALIDVVARIAQESGFDEQTALAIYLPLTRQALANAESLGVATSLTGPFMRGDAGTIADHLDYLRRAAPEVLPVYLAIAQRELDITRRRGNLTAAQLSSLERLLEESGRRT